MNAENPMERRRILVVDDDRILADMLGEYLERAGYVVKSRGTVAEGYATARREAFDAVVLDIMLPDGDGLDLCRRLRSESDVPILMLTAHEAIRRTASWASRSARTTIFRSPSTPVSCSPACGRFSAGAMSPVPVRRPFVSERSRSTG